MLLSAFALLMHKTNRTKLLVARLTKRLSAWHDLVEPVQLDAELLENGVELDTHVTQLARVVFVVIRSFYRDFCNGLRRNNAPEVGFQIGAVT